MRMSSLRRRRRSFSRWRRTAPLEERGDEIRQHVSELLVLVAVVRGLHLRRDERADRVFSAEERTTSDERTPSSFAARAPTLLGTMRGSAGRSSQRTTAPRSVSGKLHSSIR
jgi:hypothetical protein